MTEISLNIMREARVNLGRPLKQSVSGKGGSPEVLKAAPGASGCRRRRRTQGRTPGRGRGVAGKPIPGGAPPLTAKPRGPFLERGASNSFRTLDDQPVIGGAIHPNSIVSPI